MYKGMNFGGGNMQNLMRQAQKMQEQMQAQMARAEEELENAELKGVSGGGMVEVTVNGKKQVLGVSIRPEVVDPDDVEMLEDLIVAAFNEASNKADELEAKVKPNTGGLF